MSDYAQQLQFDYSPPSTNQLVEKLKENGQDFEWYPTTDEMIEAVKRWLSERATSIMDIGAGDGRVLQKFAEKCKHAELYGIEKSSILVQAQPKDIIPVGTDLFEQNLSALEVDYIFCNPRYSEYEEWACKIIEEGFSIKSFLVIPQRWKDSKLIEKSLKLRGATTRVIHSDDFYNADRQARAIIDIVEITNPDDGRYGRKTKSPFDIWFDQNIDTFDKAEEFKESETGEDLARRFRNSNISEMVEAYRTEYELMENNYRAIFQLDYEILRELGVDKNHVRDGLKMKIAGLKVKYWKILFDRLDAITSRLTTKSKGLLLEKLTKNNVVEFTATNAYAVVLWAIKNANQYFDDQAVELFYELATFEGVHSYKSNQRTWEKHGWRYNIKDDGYTHFSLDYRIVVSEWKAIKNEPYSTWEFPGNLHKNCHDVLADIVAVFSNLGFSTYSLSSYHREWEGGKWQNWYDDQENILFQAKAYLNGNIHFRFMPEAIKALNITVGRILKWVNSSDEVVTEMGYTKREAEKYFNQNMQISTSNIKLLNSSN